MSNQRKKLIAAGWLCICLASIITAFNFDENPSISWMAALGMTWALIVNLWPEKFKETSLARRVRLFQRKNQHRYRLSIARDLKNLGLSEQCFLEMLNKGLSFSKGTLAKNCASRGWRRMQHRELGLAKQALAIMIEMKRQSIRKLEKLIRRKRTSENELLERARKRHPEITDWRCLNHTEIDAIYCIITDKLPDWVIADLRDGKIKNKV